MAAAESVSIGEGLAYNYYTGYLNLVLPSLSERIDNSESGKYVKKKKLLLLIPTNAEMPPKLQEVVASISYVGALTPFVVERAGFQRKYPNHVYSIKHNEKELSFVADMPANMLTLRDMVADAKLTGFTEEDKLQEVQKYVAFLRKTLEKRPHLSEACEIIVFNDSREAEELIAAAASRA
ncbi:PREDICTED: stimulator of interferon genes protein-like [Priapulus caudatus]|uniref:Stimulator of interferon genes protein-like n=1 Tax=Priapulus caudatus TaxID=37621 RepID=A0ABM1EDE1_PRICU|nr:PREDICTED: stimulator of interferon genes protein-like [Priapulus caudatus]